MKEEEVQIRLKEEEAAALKAKEEKIHKKEEEAAIDAIARFEAVVEVAASVTVPAWRIHQISCVPDDASFSNAAEKAFPDFSTAEKRWLLQPRSITMTS